MNLRTFHIMRITAFILVFCTVTLAGCLTVETKEYRIKLRSDHSGEATIKFFNILSESDDTTDIAADDFQQLIEFYLEGSQLEKENPGFRNVKKRLYEEDGILIGEVTFAFDSLNSVRLFRYKTSGPLMYFVGNPLSSEQFIESNGTRGPDWLPVIFWPNDATEIYLKTKVVSEVPYQRSVLKYFQAWKSAQPDRDKQ